LKNKLTDNDDEDGDSDGDGDGDGNDNDEGPRQSSRSNIIMSQKKLPNRSVNNRKRNVWRTERASKNFQDQYAVSANSGPLRHLLGLNG